MNHFEIERKFLIKKPLQSQLDVIKNIRVAEIRQSYTNLGVRIRRWYENGIVKYIKTIKTNVSDITRLEIENEITREEYEQLLKEETSSLLKSRYSFPFCNKIIEIDIYPFWEDKAILEVELNDEKEKFFLPDFIEVIKEVTFDKAYQNYSLSKNIPMQ